MTEHEEQFNRLAQGLLTWDQGLAWFELLDPDTRREVLLVAERCTVQAHPLPSEVSGAIEMSGLKPTLTPCVILRKADPPERGLWKIARLTGTEQKQAFKLLVALFSIADRRRRETECRDGCSHEWQNLRK